MNLLDEQYTKTPFYGVKRMTAYLRQLGYRVNHKRVRRLLRQMGLDAIYQHPNTSKPNPEHQVYPYLLRNVPITRCNQVWSTDITYIRLSKGFVYLMAVIDWYSRYVLDWSLSTTLEADFCIDTVGKLLHNGLRCEIFNTDQGSQFTTPRFTMPLIDSGIAGVCQHSCHPYLNQATKTSLALTRLDRRTGLRAVGSTGEQFLTALPFQRAGFACFAITSTDSRLARISPSLSV